MIFPDIRPTNNAALEPDTMTTPHSYHLRAYHNPQNVPQHKIPRGWRLLYADEVGLPQYKPCLAWLRKLQCFPKKPNWLGIGKKKTYIVPINA